MSSTGILFSFNGDWITEEWIDEGKNLAVVQQQFPRLDSQHFLANLEGTKCQIILQQFLFDPGRQIEATSVLEAKAKAMKEAITEAQQHGLQRVCLESDSSLLIQCLRHAQSPPWPLRALVLGISSTMKKFAATQVLFVKREANMVADWLAIRANLPQFSVFTSANRHPELCRMLDKDIEPFLLFR
uniref:RNase H type-1 domain-containing protein n=1 Tax=Ananas comosus var. bracteatus TaxID=296719 RepID=A0A6V7PJ34_ANACO|nr:unnamed protein product [Ananas comosus var. bracteatus]